MRKILYLRCENSIPEVRKGLNPRHEKDYTQEINSGVYSRYDKRDTCYAKNGITEVQQGFNPRHEKD
jgi:hypothetical protein